VSVGLSMSCCCPLSCPRAIGVSWIAPDLLMSAALRQSYWCPYVCPRVIGVRRIALELIDVRKIAVELLVSAGLP
jgi:hypothetical protein